MLTRVNFNIRFHKIKLSSVAVQNLRQKGTVHQGEVDVRGRPDFSRDLTLARRGGTVPLGKLYIANLTPKYLTLVASSPWWHRLTLCGILIYSYDGHTLNSQRQPEIASPNPQTQSNVILTKGEAERSSAPRGV